MAVYLAKGVSPKAVEDFLKNCFENSVNVRTLQIIKGKTPVVRVAAEPYELHEPCYLYSLSKIYTSLACGLCFDDGILSPKTDICRLFADKMPEEIPENLRNLTLHDLLSMQNGHGECAMVYMRTAEDSLKKFFEVPFVHKPGTVFTYDTGSTCLCAAAVERVTGKKLVDFLYERLFSKLDMNKPRWDECMDGQTFGGTGLYVSSDDIVKLGIMLKNGGVYNGIRIISEDYLKLATSKHALTDDNGTDDWTAGYGYQFWMNGRGGFRGDGAYGQFCYVFPQWDMVVSLTSESSNTAFEMEAVYKLIDGLYGNEGEIASLEALAKTLYKPEPVEGFNDDVCFAVEKNSSDVRNIRFFGEKLLHIEVDTDYGKKEIVCGNGEYILNHVLLKNLCAGLDARDERKDTIERISVFASYGMPENGVLKVTLRHKDKPHTQFWNIDLNKGEIKITLSVGTIQTNEFKLSHSAE